MCKDCEPAILSQSEVCDCWMQMKEKGLRVWRYMFCETVYVSLGELQIEEGGNTKNAG